MLKNMKRFATIAVLAVSLALGGCFTRVGTGHVGVRTDFFNQIELTEIPEGTINQTIIGSVDKFAVREVYGQVLDQKPPVKDNILLADADIIYTYNLNPKMVADIWVNRPKAWHHYADDEIYLMRIYMDQTVKNALFNSVRHYDVKTINDHRVDIEQEVRKQVNAQLETDKFNGVITLSTVNVRNLTPPQQLMDSYAAVVRSANDLAIKENEVAIAKAEARRMAELAVNAGQSIAYMNAQAALNISEGVKNGKIHTIVVPVDFKGIVNTAK